MAPLHDTPFLLGKKNQPPSTIENNNSIYKTKNDPASFPRRNESLRSQYDENLFFKINHESDSYTCIGNDTGPSVFVANRETAHHEIIETAKKEFTELARSEEFEYGMVSQSEKYLLKFMENKSIFIGHIINKIFLDEISDKKVIISLLNAISSIDYKLIHPFGQTIAIAALSNESTEIKEAGIRAYETWGHKESIEILRYICCGIDWLDEYRKNVIADLAKTYELHNTQN